MSLPTGGIQNQETAGLLEACSVSAREVDCRSTRHDPKRYEPSFDMVEGDGGYWIRDHKRPIAYIRKNWLNLDAFEFSPFTSLGRDPEIHPRYDMGTYINMHATLLHAIGGNSQWPSGQCRLVWSTNNPKELKLTVHADYSAGERTTNTLTVGYDRGISQYLYRLKKTLCQPSPARQEFCNVYVKNLGNGMPSGKKWQYTVWTGSDGRLWRMPQNPALTYLMRRSDDARVKMLSPRGFIGWGVEEDFNLVTVIEHASVPILSATCDMWYDEHLTFEKPGMEYMGAGTTVDVECTIRFLHVPAAPMQSIVDRAQTLSFSQEENEIFGGPSFLFGQVNDLEAHMDPNVPQPGQVWQVVDPSPAVLEMEDAGRRIIGKLKADQHVAWVRDSGHSGVRSIRLKGFPHRIIRYVPVGHLIHVKKNTTYRFEGWVKTAGARARLWIGFIWYSLEDLLDEATSVTVEPNNGWSKIGVVLTNRDCPYVVCRLEIEGGGYAWYDDLYVGEVA